MRIDNGGADTAMHNEIESGHSRFTFGSGREASTLGQDAAIDLCTNYEMLMGPRCASSVPSIL
jgi:hypothetical protein